MARSGFRVSMCADDSAYGAMAVLSIVFEHVMNKNVVSV